MRPSNKGFTLIELLVVIGIIVVLSIVVVMVLNPVDMFRQARDSTRLSDMKTIHKAMQLFEYEVNGGSMGSSSVIYLSVPDLAATSSAGTDCSSLGLPSSTLPTGWQYHCAASSTLKLSNGRGWIPVDFSLMTTKSPLQTIPVDPSNVTSTGAYYTYTAANNKWMLTAITEADKYSQVAAKDGGTDPVSYEIGNDLFTFPPVRSSWAQFGNFETDAEGASIYCASQAVASSSAYGSILGSGALYVQAAVAPCMSFNYGGFSRGGIPTLITGQRYTLSFYAKSIANPGLIRVSLQSGAGDNNCLAFNFTPTSEWVLYSNTCVLDVSKPYFYQYSIVSNQQWVIDALRIEPALR